MNISTIIPVYKADKFLEKAVESAIQFKEVKEVILIEDGSPDNSLTVCKELAQKYPRVVVFQHLDKKNHGAGASRNLGIKKATKEYISFLDADDFYLPNRFETEKIIFKDKNIEGVTGALGNYFYSKKAEKQYKEKFKETQLTSLTYPAEGKEIFYNLLGLENKNNTFFHLNTLTLRAEKLKNSELFFNPTLRLHQDTDFIIKLAFLLYLKTGNIKEAIALRGIHEENRITKIKKFTKTYYENQFKLISSVYKWSLDKNLPKKYKRHLKLQKRSFYLALKKDNSTLEFYKKLIKYIIQDPIILKTRYRFNYLRKEYNLI